MRKRLWFNVVGGVLCTLCAVSFANESFDDGMRYGKAQSSQGTGAISGFNPEQTLPNFTDNPPQSGYYGGVDSPGVDLNSPGMNELNHSDVGNTITESITNTPSDNRPSLDAPFIESGTHTQGEAENITQGFDGCTSQNGTFTEITTHTCNRDVKVDQYCLRQGTPALACSGSTTTKTLTVSFDHNGASEENGNVVQRWTPPESGEIQSIHYDAPGAGVGKNVAFSVYAFGTSFTHHFRSGSSGDLAGFTPTLTAGVPVKVWHTRRPGNNMTLKFQAMTFTLVLKQDSRVCTPQVNWAESCPFDKAEGNMTASECIEPGGDKILYDNGKPYTVHQDCWAWRDTYLTQEASEGTCGEYIHDSACTVSKQTCADEVDGVCINQQVTYSCERKTTGQGEICGGEFFCTDGSCAQAESGVSHMFGQAVSSLAAVAAAGKDVAALNGVDVKAFTGKAMFCKKFAAGFNNCCKDSGWGQDVGLSSCSSEEKALGEAKEKKLTVYVGQFCSKDVLGICLEKKRGYCQFDSKLARIVQEQGRRGQLGIGFGKGKSPDCRGITIDEMQHMKFDAMDFSDFYSDLENGSTIPEDSALAEKVKDIIEHKLQENRP